ncbi:MAG: hypothetical protein EOO28_06095 [Comamonadaceae bacterium]|nr:MAG: hypothetical protein EOO28_06095 [Comamonadaceae bacterium]
MIFSRTSLAASAIAAVAALGLLGCKPAAAQTGPAMTAWYAGGNIGRSAATIDDPRIRGGLAAAGLATTSIEDRDRDTGFKLYGGYQFSPNFALEGGYADLGKFGFTANTQPAGTLNGDLRLKGVFLDAVGTWPINERFSALGRIGVTSMQAKDQFRGTGAVGVNNPNPSKRATGYKLGVGLEYAINPRLGLRAELERYSLDDAIGNNGHVDLLSAGLVYRF